MTIDVPVFLNKVEQLQEHDLVRVTDVKAAILDAMIENFEFNKPVVKTPGISTAVAGPTGKKLDFGFLGKTEKLEDQV